MAVVDYDHVSDEVFDVAFREENEIERRIKYLEDEKHNEYSVEVNRIKSLDKRIRKIAR